MQFRWYAADKVIGNLLEVEVGVQAIGQPLPIQRLGGQIEAALQLTDSGNGPGLWQVGAGLQLAAGLLQLRQVERARGKLQLPACLQLRCRRSLRQCACGVGQPLA